MLVDRSIVKKKCHVFPTTLFATSGAVECFPKTRCMVCYTSELSFLSVDDTSKCHYVICQGFHEEHQLQLWWLEQKTLEKWEDWPNTCCLLDPRHELPHEQGQQWSIIGLVSKERSDVIRHELEKDGFLHTITSTPS